MVGASGRGPVGDLQVLVDDLAEELGRSVVIDDPVVRLVCTSRHFGDEDGLRVRAVLQRDAGAEAIRFILSQGVARWTEPAMLPGRADLDMRPRLCVPLRERGELLGLLMVIDADGSLTPAQLARIEAASHGMAARMYSDRLAGDGARDDRDAREQALRDLLGPDTARRRAGQLAGALPRDAAHAVVTVLQVHGSTEPPAQVELALRTVLTAATRRRPTRTVTSAGPDRAVLLRLSDRPEHADLVEQAERMVGELHHLLGAPAECVAGIGGAVAGLADAWTSLLQADTAARGARLLPRLAGVGVWDELGPYAVLLHLPDSALTPALLPDPLRALLGHDRGARLVETLRSYLDHAGSIPRTAAALHLHRTSLYYRLGQIREITGLDLDDGEQRLRLHLGLRVADLLRR
jgi:sugar diacid utilization regulator